MSNEVAIRGNAALAPLGQEKLQLLKSVLNIKCSDNMLLFFGEVCQRIQLDPFRKQIYLIMRKDRDGNPVPAIQTGIDGYRAIAARTGEYAGQDEPTHNPTAEDEGYPRWSRATVYRFQHGQRIAYTATARWAEYVQFQRDGRTPMGLWKDRPFGMLDKCAEALALRKGFPETAGMELEGAGSESEAPEYSDEAPAGAAALNAKVAQLAGVKEVRIPAGDGPAAEQLRAEPGKVRALETPPPPAEAMPPPFKPKDIYPPPARSPIAPPEPKGTIPLQERWEAGVRAFAALGTEEDDLYSLLNFTKGQEITKEIMDKASDLYRYMAKQPKPLPFDENAQQS